MSSKEIVEAVEQDLRDISDPSDDIGIVVIKQTSGLQHGGANAVVS